MKIKIMLFLSNAMLKWMFSSEGKFKKEYRKELAKLLREDAIEREVEISSDFKIFINELEKENNNIKSARLVLEDNYKSKRDLEDINVNIQIDYK